MTLDLARQAAQALVEALSDPPPSDPPERSVSTPSISTASTPEALIDRLLTAMEAREIRWMEAMERQAAETREALITMVQGRSPTIYGPSTAFPTPIPSDLQPGPARGPGQQPLSTPTYDDDSIPLAPGIEATLAREQMEAEADRQRLLRTEPDVLMWQLEQRRLAAGMPASGPAPGSPL